MKENYKLLISDELKNILKGIEDESIVASLLLKGSHTNDELVDNPINYISISTQDSTKISYLTPDRMHDLPDTVYWTSSRRFQVKPGSFVSKLFKNIAPKEIEKFSTLFRSQSTRPKFRFKVVEGESIRQLYYYESYASDRGTLGASCMKHEACQKFLDIYTQNRDQVKMLAMFSEGGSLMGRALLWTFDSYKIMDRIYTISDEELSFYFKQWATQNGYLYKSEQNWYNTLNFEQIGQKKQEVRLELKLNNHEFRYYPYMDTFKFMDTITGTLYNYIVDKQTVRTLSSSEGGRYEHDHFRFDEIDKILINRGDSVFLEYLKIWTHCNNTKYSDINDQYILNKDFEYDEDLSDCIFNLEYDSFNNKERISSRRLELQEYRNDKVFRNRNTSANTLRPYTTSTVFGDGILNSPDIADLYSRYFSEGPNQMGILVDDQA